VVNGSKTYSISDPNTTKLIAWARTAYPVPAPDTRTDLQVLAIWADAVINALKSVLTKVDVDAAVAEAISTTPPVVIT
jgi:hypothetical protein